MRGTTGPAKQKPRFAKNHDRGPGVLIGQALQGHGHYDQKRVWLALSEEKTC